MKYVIKLEYEVEADTEAAAVQKVAKFGADVFYQRLQSISKRPEVAVTRVQVNLKGEYRENHRQA